MCDISLFYIPGISVVDEECEDSQVLEVSKGIQYAYSPPESTNIQPQAEEQVYKKQIHCG